MCLLYSRISWAKKHEDTNHIQDYNTHKKYTQLQSETHEDGRVWAVRQGKGWKETIQYIHTHTNRNTKKLTETHTYNVKHKNANEKMQIQTENTKVKIEIHKQSKVLAVRQGNIRTHSHT